MRRFEPSESAGGGDAASLSIAHKNAASVLPEPVGATTSVSSPLPIARHAPAWAGVGSANAPSNHARVAGQNPSERVGAGYRGLSCHALILPCPTDISGPPLQ